MLLHDADVVAFRVEHGERDITALRPVVAVIVIDADGGGAVPAESGGDPAGERGLARGAVAGDGQHHRPPGWLARFAALQPDQLVGHYGLPYHRLAASGRGTGPATGHYCPRMRTTLGDRERSRFPRSGEAAGEQDTRLLLTPPRRSPHPPRRFLTPPVQCHVPAAQRGVH